MSAGRNSRRASRANRVWTWLGAGVLACSAPRERASTSPSRGANSGPARTTSAAGETKSAVPPSAPAAVAEGSARRQAPLPASESCKTLARAYCRQMDRCQRELMYQEVGDVEDCVDRWGGACTRAITLAGSGFTDQHALECAAGIDKLTCGTFRWFEDLLIPACHPKGKLADESACLDDAQCRSTFCSRSAYWTESACGVCAPRAPSQGRCWDHLPGSTPRAGCQLGEICSRGHCLGPMVNEGEPCGIAAAWTSNCYRDLPLGKVLGCAAYGREGTPYAHLKRPPNAMGRCERYLPAERCEDDRGCDDSFFCAEGTCRQKRLVRPGQSCVAERDFCLGGLCEEGVCQGTAAMGEECDEDSRCSFPLVCVNGSCALTDPACDG